MVDLTDKPFFLDEEGAKWVRGTLDGMSTDEKISQLFVEMVQPGTADDYKAFARDRKVGGIRYNNAPASIVRAQNAVLQENSRIPLIIACNTEAGGNGACVGGTEVGQQVKISATNDKKYAYELGRISGTESRAVGCNCCFAPIADINMNWRNPIISSRSFGSDPDRVLEYCLEYMKGYKSSGGACVAKHFPGDGTDERDQHFSSSVNNLSVSEWFDSFGKVYRGLIDAGISGIMAGHIMFPAYQRLHGERLLPATLSRCVIEGLLRGELGFKGLVITDASHMVGLTGAMRRSELLPTAVAAGCDMILFTNDYEEDVAYMRGGMERGILTEERLDEAVTRVLAFKASLGLHKKDAKELVPAEDELKHVGSEDHLAVAKEVSDRAVTLVKCQDGVLPLSPERQKRVLIVYHESENPFAKFMPKQRTPADELKKMLEEEGFAVTIHKTLMEIAETLPPVEATRKMFNVYGNKTPISDITDNYDVVLHVAKIIDHGTVQRISWSVSKGTPDIPWTVHELPTIFVSLFCPFHLADVPQVKTYINCYDGNSHTLRALVDKLVGKSAFKGVSPVDPFCGKEDTRL